MRIIVGAISCARTQCLHFRLYISPSQKQQTHLQQILRQMSYDSSFLFHSHSVSIGKFLGLVLFRTPTPLQPPPPILLKYNNSFQKTVPWQLLSHNCSSLPLLTCTCHVKADYAIIIKLCCKVFMIKYFCRTLTL